MKNLSLFYFFKKILYSRIADLHCMKMVDNGIHEHFLLLLKKHNGQEGDLRLQHAVLSALRNLAIPAPNKALILKAGALDVLTPMISMCTLTVAFKLLACLRMLVDGQGEFLSCFLLIVLKNFFNDY